MLRPRAGPCSRGGSSRSRLAGRRRASSACAPRRGRAWPRSGTSSRGSCSPRPRWRRTRAGRRPWPSAGRWPRTTGPRERRRSGRPRCRSARTNVAPRRAHGQPVTRVGRQHLHAVAGRQTIEPVLCLEAQAVAGLGHQRRATDEAHCRQHHGFGDGGPTLLGEAPAPAAPDPAGEERAPHHQRLRRLRHRVADSKKARLNRNMSAMRPHELKSARSNDGRNKRDSV